MKKILYMIPGFGTQMSNEWYKSVVQLFRKSWFTTIPIEIIWKYKTIDDYISEFLSQATKHKKWDEVYLFGFSIGAMIAVASSFQLPVKTQFICALSPYFKEDLPHLKERWKRSLWKNRITAFERLSFSEIAKKTQCKTHLLAWELEYKELLVANRRAYKEFKNCTLTIVEEAKHDIGHKNYIVELWKIIEKSP